MSDSSAVFAALQVFARDVTAKMTQLTRGEPEDQLRGPFEAFMKQAGQALGRDVLCIGETRLPGRLGKPDYAVHVAKLLSGYVELKAPGAGANPRRFTGRNREQWKRFQAIPNLIYCDGSAWGLYRGGEPVGRVVRLAGDVSTDGAAAVTADDAAAVQALFANFIAWEPILPMRAGGRIDFRRFAELLAPLCRMLRENVTDALRDAKSPLVQLAKDWRQLLFPDADDALFADAYAQTVTFAVLLARSEGADPLTLETAQRALSADHALLSRALQVLTDPAARAEISASLDLLVRVITAVPPMAFYRGDDPWIYFYEDFLATYDPKLRKDAGAYYTPVEVVHAQVRLVDHLLRNRLTKPSGFADPEVVTLDPAVGTGTYLLGVIDHALDLVEAREGIGAVPAQASALANNLYGFEVMVGPFAVSELRISRGIQDRGGDLPAGGTHVYLTDSLESPRAVPPQLPLFLKPIADQHRQAIEVKDKVPVIVCLGNPPYDRHAAADDRNRMRSGSWVRWGDPGSTAGPILRDFVEPAIEAGHGVHVKWLYNLYVYFWRWALWKVFEHESSPGPGVVSFITASSYLFGDAFVGMRQHMRRICDEIWVLDLGGEGRGARKDENVFAIQTPVAIAVAVRFSNADLDKQAVVRYARMEGTRVEKLRKLDELTSFPSLEWQVCPDGWHAPFLPVGEGRYFDWPIIRDLFPWQHSGCQLFRTWPIAPDRETLEKRWASLLATGDRAASFRESRDRKVHRRYSPLLAGQRHGQAIAELPRSTPAPENRRYAFRNMDRQYVLADSRVGDVMKPVLWRVAGDPETSRQLFIVSQLWQVLGSGPALTATVYVPDFHHFKGSYGGKDVIPLYRDDAGTEANIMPGLFEALASAYGFTISAEDFVAYVYGVLAHPSFTARYARELESREIRVPITKDPDLFMKAREIGARLLWLQTYGQRFVPDGLPRGQLTRGEAQCVKAVPSGSENCPERFSLEEATKTLHVGEGEFRPVRSEIFEFEVSGLKIVQSWLKYRMKRGAGRKSSPLDYIHADHWTQGFTSELLELLWVLESTFEQYPTQAGLLSEITSGLCFNARELPPVPDAARQPPAVMRQGTLFALTDST